MASKVLVPAAPFTKLQVKKSPPEPTGGGFIIGGDPVARVAHLEHSVRFLQEQHRQMLSGLHAEIEALRERNRDLQFQLIFNKESSPKISSPPVEENTENNEVKLKREVTRLEQEASTARSETKAAEARAIQLQILVDAQTEKLRSLEVTSATCASCCGDSCPAESRAELRARLCEAERLVRRLRADAERQRRELHCMKNSLHASLRASGLDPFGYQNNYHFPPVHTPDFWREPLREDFNMVGSRGRSTRRPLTLPELSGQQMHRSTVYANKITTRADSSQLQKFADAVRGHTTRDERARPNGDPQVHNGDPQVQNGDPQERKGNPQVRKAATRRSQLWSIADHSRQRANGYNDKNKKQQAANGEASNTTTPKTPEEPAESRIRSMYATDFAKPNSSNVSSNAMYPELKMVVTKLLSHSQVSGAASAEPPRPRPRRARRHAPPDPHT